MIKIFRGESTMMELNVNDSITNIEEIINSSVKEIVKGRKLEELSNEELVQLNTMYKYFNEVLVERLDKNNENIENIKFEIRELLEKLKENR